mgnify:CR=1 FL=1
MNNKLDNMREERKKIVNDYTGKALYKTHVDEMVGDNNDLQYVIVKEVIQETPDTKSFILVPNLEAGTNELMPFKAGQFISVKLNINEEYVSRAYSLSSSPKTKNEYRITIKRAKDGLVSNYMCDNVKKGDSLVISRPAGNFGYNKLRDESNVIGIAGGVGLTPIMSHALAIMDGILDFNLTIFYSVRTVNDIMFKKEIDYINKKSSKVRFVITLTKEEQEGYLHGYINKEMIAPYLQEFNTVLMCGTPSLYKSMNTVLSELNIPKKSVHFEAYAAAYEPEEVKTYELKVILKNDFIETTCRSNETLLVAMEKAKIKAPSLCRVGVCGYCRSILLEGRIKMVGGNINEAEASNDYIHPCVSYPDSNITLRLDI